VLADVGGESALVVGTLDRGDPELRGALELARPFRATARAGQIYEVRPRSDNWVARIQQQGATLVGWFFWRLVSSAFPGGRLRRSTVTGHELGG
jgi:hypothetical protein